MAQSEVRSLLGPPVSAWTGDTARGAIIRKENILYYSDGRTSFRAPLHFYEDKLVQAVAFHRPLFFRTRTLYVLDERGVYEDPSFGAYFRCNERR
jgi:hypothetical protein